MVYIRGRSSAEYVDSALQPCSSLTIPTRREIAGHDTSRSSVFAIAYPATSRAGNLPTPDYLRCYVLNLLEWQPGDQLGSFRPLDDIFEDAVDKLLLSPPYTPNPKDPSTYLSKEDLLQFLSLDCAQIAMARVCEKKGHLLLVQGISTCD